MATGLNLNGDEDSFALSRILNADGGCPYSIEQLGGCGEFGSMATVSHGSRVLLGLSRSLVTTFPRGVS